MLSNFMVKVYRPWLDTPHAIPGGAGQCTVEYAWYLRENALGRDLSPLSFNYS